MKPRVSVIITTFNRPQYVSEAIKSVLGQDFKEFELIITDDASSGQGTEKTISSFHDSRIRYIRNSVNLGSAVSLNIGLREARGEYVAILDDDDFWVCPNKLSMQVDFLDRNRDYVLVGTGAIFIDEETGKEIRKKNKSEEIKDVRERLFFDIPFTHSSVLFRREAALGVGGYDESFTRGKDHDLYLKLGRVAKFEVLPAYCVKCREACFSQRDLIETRFISSGFTA